MLQPEAFELMAALADAGKTVLSETSGLVSIRGVDPRVHVIMDLKWPDSGECGNKGAKGVIPNIRRQNNRILGMTSLLR